MNMDRNDLKLAVIRCALWTPERILVRCYKCKVPRVMKDMVFKEDDNGVDNENRNGYTIEGEVKTNKKGR